MIERWPCTIASALAALWLACLFAALFVGDMNASLGLAVILPCVGVLWTGIDADRSRHRSSR